MVYEQRQCYNILCALFIECIFVYMEQHFIYGFVDTNNIWSCHYCLEIYGQNWLHELNSLSDISGVGPYRGHLMTHCNSLYCSSPACLTKKMNPCSILWSLFAIHVHSLTNISIIKCMTLGKILLAKFEFFMLELFSLMVAISRRSKRALLLTARKTMCNFHELGMDSVSHLSIYTGIYPVNVFFQAKSNQFMRY